jgi:hypothetical protein
MVVHGAQPGEMPSLARGGILLPRAQIVFENSVACPPKGIARRGHASLSRSAFHLPVPLAWSIGTAQARAGYVGAQHKAEPPMKIVAALIKDDQVIGTCTIEMPT